MALDPNALDTLLTLCIGLALAGLIASAYEWVTAQRASFCLLEAGGAASLFALPIVAVTAPFLILRTLRGRARERQPIPFVMLATMVACGWGLLSGRLAVDVATLLVGG